MNFFALKSQFVIFFYDGNLSTHKLVEKVKNNCPFNGNHGDDVVQAEIQFRVPVLE